MHEADFLTKVVFLHHVLGFLGCIHHDELSGLVAILVMELVEGLKGEDTVITRVRNMENQIVFFSHKVVFPNNLIQSLQVLFLSLLLEIYRRV